MSDKKKPDHHGDLEHFEEIFPNDTIGLLIKRASCRSFADKKVPPEITDMILRAGVHAATGGNLQPYSIIKIENEPTSQRLAELCENQDFIATAPVNLVFCIDFHRLERWARIEQAPFTATAAFRHFWISFQDTIIAAQNVCTAADSLGLGSVYIGTVLECFRELRDLLELPKGVFPVVLLSMGYPKVRPQPRKKLGVPVVVHDEKYHELEDRELMEAYNRKYSESTREITAERLETIENVCRAVHGDKFAARCIDRIKGQGYISQAQHLFGLHYRADQMPQRNEDFLNIMEDFGFTWFKIHKPAAKK